jgi:hypothetical protein
MQAYVENGVYGTRRQFVGLCYKIARRVVHEYVDRTLDPNVVHHLFDGFGISDIARIGGYLRSELLHEFGRGCLEYMAASAADDEFAPQRQKATP